MRSLFGKLAFLLTCFLPLGTGICWGIWQEPLPNPGKFAAPNETNPGRISQIIQAAPPGAYISVGTERGLMSASLSQKFSALLLVDIDPGIVFQNRLNVALIRASGGDRKEYLRLRLSAYQADWTAAAEKFKLDNDQALLLKDPRVWQWWDNNIRKEKRFSDFHRPPGLMNSNFKGANYLFSNEQFGRLYQLAEKGMIITFKANLTNDSGVVDVIKAMERKKLPLSVLDVSNVPDYFFAAGKSDEVLTRLVEQFAPVMVDDSLYVETRLEGFSKGYGVSIKRPLRSVKLLVDAFNAETTYQGFLFKDLLNPESRNKLFKLRSGTAPFGEVPKANGVTRLHSTAFKRCLIERLRIQPR